MGATWAQPPASHFAELIGDSPAMAAIRDLIDRIADTDSSVLVTGPSGSGKEVVAQRLHQRSQRAARSFVAVNCAAIPRDLLESEIFGHEAGAFTGAIRARRGRFEAADRGTLFLDEIGDMPADMQIKLLRVLETRVVERVGSMIGVPVDVRVIAATHVDLDAAITAGRFREDLFYRLNVVEIRLPALAERSADIPQLLEHFAASTSARRIHFSDSALAWLQCLPWRGNVRELRNFVERATALHAGCIVDRATAEQLTTSLRRPIDSWITAPMQAGPTPMRNHPARLQAALAESGPFDLKQVLDDVELSLISHVLGRSAGAVAESARMLGLRRTTLIEKMRRLNIDRLGAPELVRSP